MNILARQALVLIYPAHLTEPPQWTRGPLPFRHGTLRADSTARGTYHSPKAARLLYGTEAQPTRWHRWTSLNTNTLTGLGVEILRGSHHQADRGWVIVHLRGTGPDPVEALRGAARRRDAPALPIDLRELTDGHAEPDVTQTPFTLALATPAGRWLPRLYPLLRYRHWPRVDRWLWTLASRSTLADYPPDPDSRHDLLAHTLRLSADWRALVLRDGAAFVGTRSDRGTQDPFYESAELYLRTLYTDAFLLGMLQERGITSLEEHLAAALEAPRPHKPMGELEQRLARFRHRLWWRHVSHHGTANQLLTTYQDQHQLDDRFKQVLDEIADFNNTARQDTTHHTQATVGLLTIVTIPATVAFAALQVLDIKDLGQFGIALVVILIVTLAVMLTRPARILVGMTRQRLYRLLDRDQ